MSCRLKRAVLSMVVAGFALSFAAAADAQSSSGGGADAQRANHLNHDRWARGDSSSASGKHDDDRDDHHDSHDADNHAATSGPHKGELNGKLHMGDWG